MVRTPYAFDLTIVTLLAPAETPIKLGYTLLWSLCVYPRITKVVYRPLPNLLSLLIDKAETAYLYGFVALQLCESRGSRSHWHS